MGHSFPAQQLRESVRASAAHLFLRSEVRRINLEHHAGIVVQAPDDAHIEGVVRSGDAIRFQETREPSQIIKPLFAGPSEDVGSLVENREIPRETDKLPERLREIASPESPEFRVQHSEVPFVERMQDDGLVRGSERKVVA